MAPALASLIIPAILCATLPPSELNYGWLIVYWGGSFVGTPNSGLESWLSFREPMPLKSVYRAREISGLYPERRWELLLLEKHGIGGLLLIVI